MAYLQPRHFLVLFYTPHRQSATAFIDLVVVALVGWVCLSPFRFLGYYLLLAAVCLFIFEAYDYEQQLTSMLDTLDSLVDSEIISANVEYYSQPHPKERPVIETARIPTCISPDLEAQIHRRKLRAVILPDDLVIHPPAQGQADAAI